MDGRHSRTEGLLGKDGLQKIQNAKVAVIGLGGVGSFVAESLARSGVEHFLLLDSDCVSESNINRQSIAYYSTIGQPKTKVMEQRILDINPSARCQLYQLFYGKETVTQVDFAGCDFIADAIDNVAGKILLAEKAQELNIPIIAAMGAGNKLNPSCFEIADISKTTVCPLARVMRRELKARGITNYKVVYSKEQPVRLSNFSVQDLAARKKPTPASIAFVPSVAGLLMASYIVRQLVLEKKL